MLTGALVLVAAGLVCAGTTSGEVTYVAAKDGYLDVGSTRGLAMGQQLKLVRRKRPVGTCEVVQVSPDRAVCRGDRVAAGDRFAFSFQAPKVDKPAPPPPREPLPSLGEQAELRALVQQAAIEKVSHKKTAVAFTARGATTLRQEAWGITTTPGGVFGRTSLDASMRAGLGGAPHAFTAASLRVVGDLIAPADQRFRPGELVELYVWGASIGVREGLIVGELGRFYAAKVPGTLLLDGAQLGVRLFGETTEIGAYAGVIPDLVTLAPALDRVTAGAYVGLELSPVEGVMVLPRARLGVIGTPDFLTARGELQAQTEVFWRGIGTFGGSVRAGLGGTGDLLPSLDAAALNADASPLPALKIGASWRYLGAVRADFDAVSKVPPVGGSQHASASGMYEVLPGLNLGGTGGAGFDNLAEAVRGFVGPELAMPRAFGELGGLDAGYLEELGEWPGRSAWVGARFGFPALSLVTRASYFETEALGDSFREAGLMGLVDAPLLPWLSVRARLVAQQALPSLDGSRRSVSTALMGDLALSGAL